MQTVNKRRLLLASSHSCQEDVGGVLEASAGTAGEGGLSGYRHFAEMELFRSLIALRQKQELLDGLSVPS